MQINANNFDIEPAKKSGINNDYPNDEKDGEIAEIVFSSLKRIKQQPHCVSRDKPPHHLLTTKMRILGYKISSIDTRGLNRPEIPMEDNRYMPRISSFITM